MIELYINSKKVDLPEKFNISLNYGSIDSEHPSAQYNSFSKSIELPGTPTNNSIFGNIFGIESEYIPEVFDPHSRMPFELWVNQTLYQSGYVELVKINNKFPNITYSITLYGGLGDFFYSLKYDSEGNERSLSSLFWNWIPCVSGNETTPFANNTDESNQSVLRMKSYYMTKAWRELDLNTTGTHSILQDIVMMPTLNGTPSDNFDPDKILVSLRNRIPLLGSYSDTWNRLFPTSGTDSDGNNTTMFTDDTSNWSIVQATREMNPFEARSIPVKLTDLALRTKSFLETISKPINNNGFDVNWNGLLDSDEIKHSFITLGQIDVEKGIPQYSVPERIAAAQFRIASSVSKKASVLDQIESRDKITFTLDLFGGSEKRTIDISSFQTPVFNINCTITQNYQYLLNGCFYITPSGDSRYQALLPWWVSTDVPDLGAIDYLTFGNWLVAKPSFSDIPPYGIVLTSPNPIDDSKWALCNFFTRGNKYIWTAEVDVFNQVAPDNTIVASKTWVITMQPENGGLGKLPHTGGSTQIVNENTIKQAMINWLVSNNYVKSGSEVMLTTMYAHGRAPSAYLSIVQDNPYGWLKNNPTNATFKIGHYYQSDINIKYTNDTINYNLTGELELDSNYPSCAIEHIKLNIGYEYDSSTSTGSVRQILRNDFDIQQPVQTYPAANANGLVYDNQEANAVHNVQNPWDNFIYAYHYKNGHWENDNWIQDLTGTYDEYVDIMGNVVSISVAGASNYVNIKTSQNNEFNLSQGTNRSYWAHSWRLNDSWQSVKGSKTGNLTNTNVDYAWQFTDNKTPQLQFYRNYRDQYTTFALNESYIYDSTYDIDSVNVNIPLLTKDSLFSNTATPYDYLIGIAKIMNWRFVYDYNTNQVNVVSLKNYYNATRDLVLDYSNYDLDPVSIRKKYVRWEFETPDTYPAQLAHKDLDITKIDTKFDMNAETEDVLETPFKTTTEYKLSSPYFRRNLDQFPAPILNTDFKHWLYNYTDTSGQTSTTYNELKSINPSESQKWTYTNLINKIEDAPFWLLANFNSSDEFVDTTGSLVFLTGFLKNYQYLNCGGTYATYVPYLGFYDITDTMLKLNNNNACYMFDNNYASRNGTGIVNDANYLNSPSYIPWFSKVLVATQNTDLSWTPLNNYKSLYITNKTSVFQKFNTKAIMDNYTLYSDVDPDTSNESETRTINAPGIFDTNWKNCSLDMYDTTTVKITATIKITNPEDDLRTFWLTGGRTFVIEKIQNFNPALGTQYCKCILRRIKNTSNYQ